MCTLAHKRSFALAAGERRRTGIPANEIAFLQRTEVGGDLSMDGISMIKIHYLGRSSPLLLVSTLHILMHL